MSKIRRKVTVENSKTISDSSSNATTSSTSNPAAPSRRPSVFERLGPSTGSNAADVCITFNANVFQDSSAWNVMLLCETFCFLEVSSLCLLLLYLIICFLFVCFSFIQSHCRNWLKTGNCSYGNTCRYTHGTQPRGKGFSFSR